LIWFQTKRKLKILGKNCPSNCLYWWERKFVCSCFCFLHYWFESSALKAESTEIKFSRLVLCRQKCFFLAFRCIICYWNLTVNNIMTFFFSIWKFNFTTCRTLKVYFTLHNSGEITNAKNIKANRPKIFRPTHFSCMKDIKAVKLVVGVIPWIFFFCNWSCRP
jgi:hypothetical protein